MPTVEQLLKDHVTLDIECTDRMLLNGYVPTLQTGAQMVSFLIGHRANHNASPALLRQITKGFCAEVKDFAESQQIPMFPFDQYKRKGTKKVRKDEVAAVWRKKRPGQDQVTFIGVAQEKQRSFYVRKETAGGKMRFEYSPTTVSVNHYYFYLDDADFGPCFIKVGTYAPFPVRVCINGHEWAKRQLQNKGIPFQSLDNGFRSCLQPQLLQEICDSFGPEQIQQFFLKWLQRLPWPLSSQDCAAGYTHQLSVWQLEFSRTQVFDRPVHGRQFFENVIRENLDLGRPERVQLLFDRKIIRTTPGHFRTRIITHGVLPSLHISYKTSDLKQYFKDNWALRTEFTINNPTDFNVKKGVANLPYLIRIARNANRRLLQVQRVSHKCVLSEASVERLTEPSVNDDGTRVPGLRFANPRVAALLAAITLFLHLPNGFRNRDLRPQVAHLMGLQPEQYRPGQMTYDLRRLRLKGLISRKPGTTRYRLTPYGLGAAVFLTRIHSRLFPEAFACIGHAQSTHVPHPLRGALDQVNAQIDRIITEAHLTKHA